MKEYHYHSPLTWFRCQTLMASAKNKDKGKPIANNTRLYEMWYRGEVSFYTVELHGHEIMQVHRDGWVIDACGWYTVTTKQRLNLFIHSDVRIYQRDWDWYVDTTMVKGIPFHSGMFINEDGIAWKNKAGYDKHIGTAESYDMRDFKDVVA